MERSEEAWREVGRRFASWGRLLSEHYGDANPGESVEGSQRRLAEAARQIGDEMDRAFRALDDTLRDEDAEKNLKDAVGSIGGAITAAIDDAASTIWHRGDSDVEPRDGHG